tara:strand:- start:3 stop:185 length:183 start_codon:yes stop_codon:yes gene_type:complete
MASLFSIVRRYSVATPGFMLGVVFNVLVDEQVILLFEARPPILLDWNTELDKDVLHTLEA